MNLTVVNLYAPDPTQAGETIDVLLHGRGFRLEHIVSRGMPTPEGDWYDQPGPEWVLLVRGTATLAVDDGTSVDLRAGDATLIPARCRHRVTQCSIDAVWLALHFSGD